MTTKQTSDEVERFHQSPCDKYEVLRGIYPDDRRLTGKPCSCGFEQSLLTWRDTYTKEQVAKENRLARIDELEMAILLKGKVFTNDGVIDAKNIEGASTTAIDSKPLEMRLASLKAKKLTLNAQKKEQ